MTFLPMAYCTFRRHRCGCPCAHGKLRMPENTGDRTAAEAELLPRRPNETTARVFLCAEEWRMCFAYFRKINRQRILTERNNGVSA